MDPGGLGCRTIDVPSGVSTPAAVVRFLAGELSAAHGLSAEHVELIVAEVLRREQLGSTGIGGGVAIPHASTDLVAEPAVLLGRLAAPIDWQAIDGEPVGLVCLLLSPRTNPGARLRHLESIVRSLRGDPGG